jgi:phenylalanyl-tRNA synthetase beta chain
VYTPKDEAAAAQAGMQAGDKSWALRLTLGSFEATLQDEQIDAVVAAVLRALGKDLGARQRA